MDKKEMSKNYAAVLHSLIWAVCLLLTTTITSYIWAKHADKNSDNNVKIIQIQADQTRGKR